MGKNWIIFLLIVLLLLTCSSSATPTPAAKVVSGVVTKVVSALFKWLWSLNSPPKTAIASRSMIKFESGYNVETVFDGSKLGIEPYAVEVSPSGDLLLLDSENSNVYKISTPISRYSRPKLLAGSSEGYSGHVDGRPWEARMNHPKSLTVDDRGNIYVADTVNMVIRKISDDGVVTIAGGKWDRGGGHVDGPSEDARFSDDFDVVYLGSSCTLLVIDRGNQAIREIQLNDSDCSGNEDDNLHLGVALLAAACFFGYMLALLQHRVRAIFSSREDLRPPIKDVRPAPYQQPPKSTRPPLIPVRDEYEQLEDGVFSSIGRLVVNTSSSALELFGGLFSRSRKKPLDPHFQHQYHQSFGHNSSHNWPVQDSFAIADGDGPPSIESRDPTPGRAKPVMTNDLEHNHHGRQSQPFHGGRNGEFTVQYNQHHGPRLQQYHQHHQKHQSSSAQTFYEPSSEAKEIVFGAVQEQEEQRETIVIEAVDYGDSLYSDQNLRSRYNYMSYSYGY
ncbi:hypothetical protein LIER_42330 [Lithospermum erythrorhizon]|uniref:NHL repeat-containing protein n=1 Tax=Lithospermum erythrorhizon TaxID=34254 RepID=A0AAV3RRL5_LITER